MEARRVEYAQYTMTLLQMNAINEHYFVYIDEPAVYFDSDHNCIINEKGSKIVLVLPIERCIFCVTVGRDGRKLPFSVIFKRSTYGRLAKELPFILPYGMYGFTQEKTCMDNRMSEE